MDEHRWRRWFLDRWHETVEYVRCRGKLEHLDPRLMGYVKLLCQEFYEAGYHAGREEA